jgi:molybdopterin-biosynthesis enzyme MoeA-like protein
MTIQGGEGDVAKPLKDIQDRFPQVIIGSYPFESPQGFATNLVLRSRDQASLASAANEVRQMAVELTSNGKVRGWS